ncbi:hypothetical protein K402DRAFT_392975 [Aulographum hederae CBS 113979]|uniref:lytic cellulose monooxygenase (C4-dehydrogenating) n=1 Tax=Aulographum hederae CBS 113979 TaxID=1176131 RepID=A0A6G1H232_9PEZI|nr:hypothetical protein K402DRAFT_392975 [Aulographum hederae CBS 113979]
MHVWSSDKFLKDNAKWTVTVPHDIAPRKYVVRHENLALHFASKTDPIAMMPGMGGAGAQSFVMCANVQVSGQRTTTPKGVKFPPAYSSPNDPGIFFDIYHTKAYDYKPPGPPVYKPSTPNVKLAPLPKKVESPMGSPAADEAYAKTWRRNGSKSS